MAKFTESDIFEINDSYKMLLSNLRDYLKQYNANGEIEYSKIIFNLLHGGILSMNGKVHFDAYYDYLALPSQISQGVHVTYGIICCRHATDFLYDLLCILEFNPTLVFYFVDEQLGIWRKVNPGVEKTNHKAILSSDGTCIIDPANKFILQTEENGKVKSLDIEIDHDAEDYRDPNIETIGKILKKYYMYRELGIENVY